MQKTYQSFGARGIYPARSSGRVTGDQLDWYSKVSHDADRPDVEWCGLSETDKRAIRTRITAVLEELGYEVW